MPRRRRQEELIENRASGVQLDVGVTVISFNHKELLEQCLHAVSSSLESARVSSTIVVLDNASHDGSTAMVRTHFPDVRLIEQRDVRDFAVNQNQLFALCEESCRHVLMLNDDAIVGPDTVQRLLAAMESDDRIAAIGPKLVYADGSFQTAGERLPGWGYHLLRHLGVGRFVPSALRFRAGGRDTGRSDGHVIREVGYVAGACVLVRSEALRDVGHLDERFRMYGEDADWCGECWRRGWKVCTDPSVTVVHHRRQSWSAFSAVERERSMFTYLRKHNVGGLRLGVLRALFVAKYRARLAAARISGQSPDSIATLQALVEVGLKA